MTRLAVNGIDLNVVVRGEGTPLVLLHGFTGSSETWAPFVDLWPGYRTISVDLHGHGQSDAPRDPDRYRVKRCVDDLAALLDHFEIEKSAVLGYSMGGRVALYFAIHAPERVSALVIESASPGIEDAAERAERRRTDGLLADSIEADGIEAFVDYWEAIPLFTTQSQLPAVARERLRAQRLANSPCGLASSLRGLGAGEQVPLYDRLGEIATPTLLIAGADDEKYRAIAARTAELIPDATLKIVPNAGHAVHLEQPRAFVAHVHEFFTGSLEGKEATVCR